MITWVKQEDAKGCGIAAIAMLTGQSYVEVNSHLVKLMNRTADSFGETGINHLHIDQYLASKGFAIVRRLSFNPFTNRKKRSWPRAFCDAAYCEVEQLATGNWHFVVLLRDGSILDPLHSERKSFGDYKRISSITGVFKVQMGAA